MLSSRSENALNAIRDSLSSGSDIPSKFHPIVGAQIRKRRCNSRLSRLAGFCAARSATSARARRAFRAYQVVKRALRVRTRLRRKGSRSPLWLARVIFSHPVALSACLANLNRHLWYERTFICSKTILPFSTLLHGIPLRPNTMTGEAWERARQLPCAALKLKGLCITARRSGSRTDGSISQKAANSNSRCDSHNSGKVYHREPWRRRTPNGSAAPRSQFVRMGGIKALIGGLAPLAAMNQPWPPASSPDMATNSVFKKERTHKKARLNSHRLAVSFSCVRGLFGTTSDRRDVIIDLPAFLPPRNSSAYLQRMNLNLERGK